MALSAGPKSPGGRSSVEIVGARSEALASIEAAGRNWARGTGALGTGPDVERTSTLGRGPPSGGRLTAAGGDHLATLGHCDRRWSVPWQI